MAFGQDKPVPLRVLWLIRPDTKNAEIQRRQNVDGGHFPADMAGRQLRKPLADREDGSVERYGRDRSAA